MRIPASRSCAGWYAFRLYHEKLRMVPSDLANDNEVW